MCQAPKYFFSSNPRIASFVLHLLWWLAESLPDSMIWGRWWFPNLEMCLAQFCWDFTSLVFMMVSIIFSKTSVTVTKSIKRMLKLLLLRGAFNKFPDFFVQAFKIVLDSWKLNMLWLYILWDNGPIFMIPGSNEQLQQQLENILLKPDCHRWWISKMQSGCEDTLEERYAIKFCFKLGKNDATETYGMLQTTFRPSCINRAPVFEWH